MYRLPPPAARTHRGFSLVEVMVSVAIALFLLAGLMTITQNNRRAVGNQNQLSQLQDAERTAMTMITNVIQRAGYFPDPYGPTGNTPTSVFPVTAQFATAGQSVVGTAGDSILVRYVTTGNDNLISCSGSSNPGAQTVWTNQFSVINNQLVCTLSANGGAGTPFPLVSNVTQLDILYGVKRNIAASGNSVDSYVKAADMTAADWSNLISVQVTLTFLYTPGQDAPGQFGQGQTQKITFSRVIDVMSVGGVTI